MHATPSIAGSNSRSRGAEPGRRVLACIAPIFQRQQTRALGERTVDEMGHAAILDTFDDEKID
jgi:hypothetical protein